MSLNQSIPSRFVAGALLTAVTCFAAAAEQPSAPPSEGGVVLKMLQTGFDFRPDELEEGLCQRSRDEPFKVFFLATPPRFNKPIINPVGSGSSGKVFLQMGPGDLGPWQEDTRAPLVAQSLCLGDDEPIELSCGRFRYRVRLDGDQPEGSVIFRPAPGQEDTATDGGIFRAALPVKLRFDFIPIDHEGVGQAVADVVLQSEGFWSTTGLDGSPFPGEGLAFDTDCDGVDDQDSPVSGVYLGVETGPEGAVERPFCAANDSGQVELCVAPAS